MSELTRSSLANVVSKANEIKCKNLLIDDYLIKLHGKNFAMDQNREEFKDWLIENVSQEVANHNGSASVVEVNET